jgi:hypothetical protein
LELGLNIVPAAVLGRGFILVWIAEDRVKLRTTKPPVFPDLLLSRR